MQQLPKRDAEKSPGRDPSVSSQRKSGILLGLYALLCAALLVLMLLHLKPQPGSRIYYIPENTASMRRSSGYLVPEPDGPVNVNTAGVEELCTMKHIGPATAEAIILEREQNGPFYYREDLLNVKGIGEKTLQKMDGQFCLN